MADRQGVHRLVHPSANSLNSDFIDSSSPEFIAIRRKMVSNLVSNGWGGQVPPTYTLVSYTSLTPDWGLVIVNWVYLQLHPILTVLSDQWVGQLMHPAYTRGHCHILLPLLVKEER